MTEDTANKFAELFAKCAATGNTAPLRKEAEAQALVKSAISAEQVLLPALAATGGGLVGYFGTKDEKRKKRNAITGALLGGGGSAAMQAAYSALSQPGDANTETPGGANDLARLTGGLLGGRAGYRATARFLPTDTRVGELARAAQPVTAGRSWADWYHGRTPPDVNNKTLMGLFKQLSEANHPSTGRTTGDAVDSVLAGGRVKAMQPRTRDVLIDALNSGQLPSDGPSRSWFDWARRMPKPAVPTGDGTRSDALNVLSSSLSPSGATSKNRIDNGAIAKFLDARQRGLGRFAAPTAGGVAGGLLGSLSADQLMQFIQNAMSSSSEAK